MARRRADQGPLRAAHGRGRDARRRLLRHGHQPRGPGSRRRRAAARSCCRRGPRSSSPPSCRPVSSSSTSARTRCAGSSAPSVSARSPDPGWRRLRTPRSAPTGVCSPSGPATVTCSSAASRSSGELLARLAPGRLLALVGRFGERQILAAVRRRDRRRGSRRGPLRALGTADHPRCRAAAGAGRRRQRAARRRPVRGALHAVRRPRAPGGASSMRCSAAPRPGRDRGPGRLLRGDQRRHQPRRAVAANQVLLGPMGERELRRAIEAPARLVGLALEPGLVDLVLRDAAGAPGTLPLISHALRATWERRDGRTLSVQAYCDTGGVISAVAQTAEAIVEATPDAQRPLLRGIFLRLTELGERVEDTRRRVPIDDLIPHGASAARGARAARAPRGGAPRHARRRDRRARARGADPSLAATAGLARRGSRGDPAVPAPVRRGAQLGGRRTPVGRPLPRRAAGRCAGVGGRQRSAAERHRARLPRQLGSGVPQRAATPSA